jgi:hypothetical protein
MNRTSREKAPGFSALLIAALGIAAMAGLAACEQEVKTSSRPGSIKLTLTFPAFTGAEAVTRLEAALSKADGTGTLETLEQTAPDFSDSEIIGEAKSATLAFASVPSGRYILLLTFYRGETIAASSIEGLTVQPGWELNKWQGHDGPRIFRENDFRSTAVAASFILRNSDGSIVPISMTDPMPRSWQIDKSFVKNNGAEMRLEISLYGGPGTSLLAVTCNDEPYLFTTTNGGSSIPVYTGTFDIGTDAALICVEVQAPDRTTTVLYTIHQNP